jgi:hypothetical protein
MWTWDGLSLALCHAWPQFTARGVPTVGGFADIEVRERGASTFTLDPWPFAATRVHARCEARWLDGGYEDVAAMAAAFAEAKPVTIEFTLEAR